MRGVESTSSGLVLHFDHDEAALLAGVVDQLTDILDQARPAAPSGSDDPFALWEAEFGSELTPSVDDVDDDEVDPVVRRLFPDAYPGDAAASDEFRRFTQPALAAQKVEHARVVVADLQTTGRRGTCRVPAEHVDAWLRTLTDVRLALATRLGITDEVSADEASQFPEDDPRSWLYDVYAWTGWVQESILDVL